MAAGLWGCDWQSKLWKRWVYASNSGKLVLDSIESGDPRLRKESEFDEIDFHIRSSEGRSFSGPRVRELAAQRAACS